MAMPATPPSPDYHQTAATRRPSRWVRYCPRDGHQAVGNQGQGVVMLSTLPLQLRQDGCKHPGVSREAKYEEASMLKLLFASAFLLTLLIPADAAVKTCKSKITGKSVSVAWATKHPKTTRCVVTA
jgi:hypothetical protein